MSERLAPLPDVSLDEAAAPGPQRAHDVAGSDARLPGRRGGAVDLARHAPPVAESRRRLPVVRQFRLPDRIRKFMSAAR